MSENIYEKNLNDALEWADKGIAAFDGPRCGNDVGYLNVLAYKVRGLQRINESLSRLLIDLEFPTPAPSSVICACSSSKPGECQHAAPSSEKP